MLQVRRISCRRGRRELFSDVSFVATEGEAVRICGRNGCGKTSLLRILCGLSSPEQGEVHWKGNPIARLRETFWRDVIYVGHAAGLKDDLLSWENLAMTARLSGHSIGRRQAMEALRRLGVAGACDLPARALSQGQRRRVALARLCLGLQAPLWILDEPAASLDDEAVISLRGVLDAHLARGGIVVHATHQSMPLAARRHVEVELGQDVAC